jgi:predicted Zn-dependent protease
VPDGYEAAGAYSTGAVETAVFTSAGQAVAAVIPSAQLTTVVAGPTSSGWAEAGGRSVAAVDPSAAGRRAAEKALAGVEPIEIEPGDWPVVLEPAATGALVEFLAYLGFGGRAWLEQRACTSGRLGEVALDPSVTIVDDALSPDAVGFPFDAEGMAKQRIELVRNGVLNAVVHDRATGAKAGTHSTGHGLPAPNTWGPLPVDAHLLAGDGGSVEDLVGGMDRGLLVTRFHYVNVVHPLETVLTGMTRDGTFLVSEGRVVAAVRNLRFQQSVLAALASVQAISTETAWTSEIFGGCRSPAVRLPSFTFPSTTTFG